MQHRPGPFATIDERRAEPVPYQDDPFGIDRNFHGNARGNPAPTVTSPELDPEQQRQSEIARIRNEIMDIAREVAELRRHEHDPAPAAKPNRGRPPRARNVTEIEPPRIPAPISLEPASRNRPQEQRPPVSGGRRPQLVERAHKNSRTGKAEPAIPSNAAPARAGRPPLSIRDEVLQFAPAKPTPPAKAIKPAASKPLGMVARTALLTGMILVGTGVITAGLFGKLTLPMLEQLVSETTASIPPAKTAKQPPLQLASVVDHAPLFEMPETYGVYAINDGHLTPLDPLPVRIPDARVSISSPVSKPAPAPLPSGNLQFAVYHRELATNVPESASVRIVAKVMQATTFVNGKPKAAAVEDIWAVRGGSIDLRIAPVAANKEMILIRPADPAFTLSPGRYVLVFRNQAYDFSVAGAITDTAQCLERSDLQDRSVYSECRELPDAAKS